MNFFYISNTKRVNVEFKDCCVPLTVRNAGSKAADWSIRNYHYTEALCCESFVLRWRCFFQYEFRCLGGLEN